MCPRRCFLTSRSMYRAYNDRTNNGHEPDHKQTVNSQQRIINGHHLTMNVCGTDITLELMDMYRKNAYLPYEKRTRPHMYRSCSWHPEYIRCNYSCPFMFVSSQVATSSHQTSPNINRTNTGHITYEFRTKRIRNAQILNKTDDYRITFIRCICWKVLNMLKTYQRIKQTPTDITKQEPQSPYMKHTKNVCEQTKNVCEKMPTDWTKNS